jgi:hypothetical protein
MSGHEETKMHFTTLTSSYEKLAPITRGEPLLSAYYEASPSAYVSLMDELLPRPEGWFKPREATRTHALHPQVGVSGR